MPVESQLVEFAQELREHIFDYLKSDGPGGQQIISAFMEEFEALADRSPTNDPTNIAKHIDFILQHLRDTWDSSIQISDDGEVSVGVGKDSVLGFTEDRSKLLHNPVPVVWVVYLIRGIAGRYAFISPDMYAKKHLQAMPGNYHGGFLISQAAWKREGWDSVVGSFEGYEHPASGASPIPFFQNVMERVELNSIIDEALGSFEPGVGANS